MSNMRVNAKSLAVTVTNVWEFQGAVSRAFSWRWASAVVCMFASTALHQGVEKEGQGLVWDTGLKPQPGP